MFIRTILQISKFTPLCTRNFCITGTSPCGRQTPVVQVFAPVQAMISPQSLGRWESVPISLTSS